MPVRPPARPDPARTERRNARKAARHERSRREILDVAQELLASRRVPTFSIEEIASRAGVSPPAIYYYFRSKEEIVGALVAECATAGFDAQLAAVREAATGADALEALMRAYCAHYQANLHAFRLEFIVSQLYGVPRNVLDGVIYARGEELFGAVEAKLRADRRAARLAKGADPRRLAFAAWLAAYGLVSSVSLFEAAGVKAKHAPSDVLEELCALFRRAAAGPPSRATARSPMRRGGSR